MADRPETAGDPNWYQRLALGQAIFLMGLCVFFAIQPRAFWIIAAQVAAFIVYAKMRDALSARKRGRRYY